MNFGNLVRWCTSNRGWYTLSYFLDWLITGALLILNIAAFRFLLDPSERYVPDNFQELQYPGQPEITPLWMVILISMILPVGIFLVFQIALRSFHDLHHACLGLFETLVFNQVFTNSLQFLGGKYTPDWYYRVQTGVVSEMRVGRLSYPSWNSSTAFASMVYFSLYLAGKLGIFRERSGHMWKAIVVLVPIFGAALVAVSGTLDYHSGFDDITAGALLGICLGTFFYKCNFHPLQSDFCHLPLSRNFAATSVLGGANPREIEVERRVAYHRVVPEDDI